jgi:hypothetical protein
MSRISNRKLLTTMILLIIFVVSIMMIQPASATVAGKNPPARSLYGFGGDPEYGEIASELYSKTNHHTWYSPRSTPSYKVDLINHGWMGGMSETFGFAETDPYFYWESTATLDPSRIYYQNSGPEPQLLQAYRIGMKKFKVEISATDNDGDAILLDHPTKPWVIEVASYKMTYKFNYDDPNDETKLNYGGPVRTVEPGDPLIPIDDPVYKHVKTGIEFAGNYVTYASYISTALDAYETIHELQSENSLPEIDFDYDDNGYTAVMLFTIPETGGEEYGVDTFNVNFKFNSKIVADSGISRITISSGIFIQKLVNEKFQYLPRLLNWKVDRDICWLTTYDYLDIPMGSQSDFRFIEPSVASGIGTIGVTTNAKSRESYLKGDGSKDWVSLWGPNAQVILTPNPGSGQVFSKWVDKDGNKIDNQAGIDIGSSTGVMTITGTGAFASQLRIYKLLAVFEIETSIAFTPTTFPSGKFMNGYVINTPYGDGYHVDTSGSRQYGYTFLAYYPDIVIASPAGEISISGYFRQYDTFYGPLPVNRRFLRAYVLNTAGNSIITSHTVLDHGYGTGWYDRAFTITGLTAGQSYKIGFGRADSWSSDWQLTAEWANVKVSYIPVTLPSGKHVNGYSISTPYGDGYHVDTSGSRQYGYTFLAYYPDNVVASPAGEISISGYFRQYDTFYGSLPVNRRFLRAYVLNTAGNSIITSHTVLDHGYGTGWYERAFTITGLTAGQSYKISFGRADSWSSDWKLTAEWASVSIN